MDIRLIDEPAFALFFLNEVLIDLAYYCLPSLATNVGYGSTRVGCCVWLPVPAASIGCQTTFFVGLWFKFQ